jgi:large subunit ribosomal protein L24
MIKRSTRAKAQFRRKVDIERERARVFDEKKTDIRRKQFIAQQKTAQVNAYRNAIVDWKLGPLAPRRNVGQNPLEYGGIPRESSMPPRMTKYKEAMATYVPYHTEVMKNKYRPEDRVVIIRGQERGMIGKVQSVEDETQTLKLIDLHKVRQIYR